MVTSYILMMMMMEEQEYLHQLPDQINAITSYIYLHKRLQKMDFISRHREKNQSPRNEMLQTTPWHQLQRPYHKRRSEESSNQ